MLQATGRIELEVGGREAQFATALLAMHDFARNEPGMAEQFGRLHHAARFQRGADGAGGNRPPFVFQRRYDVDRKAEPLARFLEKGRRAAPPLTEMEIEADRNAMTASRSIGMRRTIPPPAARPGRR